MVVADFGLQEVVAPPLNLLMQQHFYSYKTIIGSNIYPCNPI